VIAGIPVRKRLFWGAKEAVLRPKKLTFDGLIFTMREYLCEFAHIEDFS
jgi:hypothetical protein